jgi:hypothetical protein
MMMRMLEAGGLPVLTDAVRPADEDNPQGYYEFELVKQLETNQAWLADARGKAVKMVYRLLYFLPSTHSYRVVFMNRKLEEVIASQEVMLARKQRPGSSLGTEQLASAFRTELRKVRSWLETQNHLSVLFVDYHNVIGNPEQAATEINEFLGLGLDKRGMARVAEPTLYRQRR